MTIETITIDHPVEVSGYDMARCLNAVAHRPTKTHWLNEFLKHADEASFGIIEDFVKQVQAERKGDTP